MSNAKINADLVKIAKEVSKNSYSPYSKYKVGAAILAKNGKIYSGVNVENASYGLTICAERSALCAAISDGNKQILRIAVYADSSKLPVPCGACLQALSEFSKSLEIVVSCKKPGIKTFTLKDLLTTPF